MAFVGDQVIHLNDDIEYNYILAQGNQSYTGSNNRVGQVSSAAMFCGHQEGGKNTGGTMANNLHDYSGAFFPFNQSGSTCGTDFPVISDFNAGTGRACNLSSCN